MIIRVGCSVQNARDFGAIVGAPSGGSRAQGTTPHLRMQAYQHNGVPCAGRESLPVPMHNRILSHLCRHSVRHVEEHLPHFAPLVELSGRCWGASGPPRATSPARLQATSPPLLRGLRACAQGLVCGYSGASSYHHLSDTLLRAHLQARVRQPRGHGGEHL